jgi:thiamine biosynthesis lipoprotein
MQYHRFRAMNTAILLAAEGPHSAQAFESAQSFIERSEQRFTRFKETSELSALNRSAGDWFTVSPELLDVLILALECHRATNGIFDPAILPDLQAVGYTRSFDQLLERGADAVPAVRPRSKRIPFDAIDIDSLQGQVRLPEGMQIDLGGIAKGWIAEKAANKLAEYSTVCGVNAGGDMFLIGQPHGHTTWEIALEDPRNPIQDLMTLLVEGGAVATSSVVKRSWKQDDIQRHHLIDPRTGEPAQTPWLSVTVFAPKAVLAETFAKSILIAGPAGAQSLLDHNPDISFIAVDADGQIWKSPVEKEKVYEYA